MLAHVPAAVWDSALGSGYPTEYALAACAGNSLSTDDNSTLVSSMRCALEDMEGANSILHWILAGQGVQK